MKKTMKFIVRHSWTRVSVTYELSYYGLRFANFQSDVFPSRNLSHFEQENEDSERLKYSFATVFLKRARISLARSHFDAKVPRYFGAINDSARKSPAIVR